MAPDPAWAADRDLIVDAALEAGRLALGFFRADPETWEKPDDAGPVTEADLAVDRLLAERLRAARPSYGWLSEETEDDPARLGARSVFIVDPIDGTRAFIDGKTGWAVAIAVAIAGEVVAAVVHLPARGETYAAAKGAGATLNGAAITCSTRQSPDGATALGAASGYGAEHWPGGAPQVERAFRHALEWRLCLVAAGSFDLMATLRAAWEWDVAAGSLIAEEAGAKVSGAGGEGLVFNTETARLPGLIVAPPAMHAELLRRRLV
ncbi:MAG: 3'(2'),5'-bisphosphate nucleotidase CysQ [Pseudomonadota bacterium]